MQYIECTIFNKEANLELPVDLKSSTNVELFLSKTELEKSNRFLNIDPDYSKWILSVNKYKKVFDKISETLGTTTEEILRLFLELIAREDVVGYNLLCKSKFSTKDCFLKNFEDYMQDFIAPGITNIIPPDILLCTVCHFIFNKTNNQKIELPLDILPYVLNIEEEKPDNYPEGFDPNIKYNQKEFKV